MNETLDEDKPEPVRVGGGGKCPTCGKPVDPRFRPFCSQRCADVDLHRWLKESYRIPTNEGPGEGADAGAAGQDQGYEEE